MNAVATAGNLLQPQCHPSRFQLHLRWYIASSPRPCSNKLGDVRAAVAKSATAAPSAAQGLQASCAVQAAVPAVQLDPEVKARHKRPPGWVAPGPQPVAASQDSQHQSPDETLSYLTGDWRIIQLKNGHRWSMDDMVTAYIALQEVKRAAAAADPTAPPWDDSVTPQPTSATGRVAGDNSSSSTTTATVLGGVRHHLDLGCGIGSVLLMVAWGLRRMYLEQQQQQQQPQGPWQQQQQKQQQEQRQHAQQSPFPVQSVGVEAQQLSYRLALRSIEYNLGSNAGVQVFNQDLRQPLPAGLPAFDLITGTPPYLPLGSGGESNRPQKAPCCLEIRGGIEDYCQAAAAALAPGGTFVVCCGLQGQPFKGKRAQWAAAAAGLVITRQVTIVTREGKPPLFAVYVMKAAAEVLSWQEQQTASSGQLQQPPLLQEQLSNTCNWQDHSHLQLQTQWPNSQQMGVDTRCAAGVLESGKESLEAQVLSGQLRGSEELFVVRHADGRHTLAWHAAREAMGLPPLAH